MVRPLLRHFVGLLVVLLPVLLLFSMPTFGAKKQATPVVNRDHEIRMRDYMIEISRQLGVTCNYCHDVKNFRLKDMKTWKKSKEHMRIVELLNARGFVNGPKADCYLCHRGKAVPDYKENPVPKD